jgi:biopolymer transport protein ExbB
MSGKCSFGGNVYVQVYGLDRIAKVNPSTGEFIISDVPAGIYDVRFVFSSPDIPPKTTTAVNVVPQDTVKVPWSDWNLSKRLDINTTSSGANVSGTIVHFPMLVRLSGSNFDFRNAAPDGRDIRFAKSDNTPLPFEIERWDAVNGQAELWVKMDTVYGNNASQYITMYWGNTSAVSASNSAMVFDTADNFQGVWHLADSSISTIRDATANHYNGIRYGVTPPWLAPGAIGLAQKFDGATGYIRFPNTAASGLNFPAKGHYTLSAWVYAQSLDSAFHQILSKGDQQYGLQIHNTNKWELFEFDESMGWQSVYSPAASKQWVYITGVCDGEGKYLYVNGTLASSTIVPGNGTVRNTGFDVDIGRISDTSFSMRYWNGSIDEVNCSGAARSSDWVKLCYMNQKAIDALITFR